MPSFVQGYTKSEFKNLIKKRMKSGWKAISLDGSAFDSTQNATMMAEIDNVFFKGIKSGL
jgi:hypothetical protein